MITIKRTVFLDLDDVVADWLGAACQILNLTWERNKELIPVSEWEKLVAHERFYRDLPVLDGAHDLVQWAVEFTESNNMGLAFLTALPPDGSVPYCREDKIHWVNTHFPHVPLTFGPYPADKPKHCKPGDILIDDRPENCRAWEEAGGIAHLYVSWDECKNWIESVLVDQYGNN